jgi:UDP-N-acetylglucosamine 2-epimerase (non-hydrolysing)
MKLAAITREIERYNNRLENGQPGIDSLLVHTGQHYDEKMSGRFFTELQLPEPDVNLEAGGGTHSVQTAEIMKRFEPILLQHEPDILLVVGDVNSTLACTLVASKIEYSSHAFLKRPVIVHVEAGLRSFDTTMPEEINRIVTDKLSDLLFITEQSGLENLLAEGVGKEKSFLVGNVMIDTLIHQLSSLGISPIREDLRLASGEYALVTLHRPSNVDAVERLEPFVNCLIELAGKIKLVFPVHPRTKQKLVDFNLINQLENHSDIYLLPPLGYRDFLDFIRSARLGITDSGGIQEETTFLRVPCVTLRENTERPVTVDIGSNYLVGTKPAAIVSSVEDILDGKGKRISLPPFWDGKAAERILETIVKELNHRMIH